MGVELNEAHPETAVPTALHNKSRAMTRTICFRPPVCLRKPLAPDPIHAAPSRPCGPVGLHTIHPCRRTFDPMGAKNRPASPARPRPGNKETSSLRSSVFSSARRSRLHFGSDCGILPSARLILDRRLERAHSQCCPARFPYDFSVQVRVSGSNAHLTGKP